MDDTIPEAYAIHTINILRLAEGHRQKAHEALLDLEGHLIGKVATAKNLNQQARLEALLKQTQGTIGKTYDTIAANHGKDLAGIAALEGKQARKVIGAAIGADVLSVGTTPNQLAAVAKDDTLLGHSSKAWWKQQDARLQHNFAGQMRQGILSGETNDQLVRRVRGTAKNDFNDGIMAASRRDATAIVRSSAISTSNTARLETLRSMDDVVKAIQWLSTLDGKTTLICIGLSGLTWTVDTLEPIGHSKAFPGVTAHWNCRSTQIPVLKSWQDLTKKKLPSLDGQELEKRVKAKLAARGMNAKQIEAVKIHSRASMDGQVNKAVGFDDWLTTKDDTFIDDLLGPGRARLWNRGNGQVPLSALTDQTNRPLTLKQLAAQIERGTPIPETKGLRIDQLEMDFPTPPAPKVLDDTFEPDIGTAKGNPDNGPAKLAKLLPGLQPGDIHTLASGRAGEWVELRPGTNPEGPRVRLVIDDKGVVTNRFIYRDAEGNTVLENDYYKLQDTGTGRGFHTFYDQVQTATRLGVTKIKTTAGGFGPGSNPGRRQSEMNGYYTWPRFGYDAEIIPGIAKKASKELGRPITNVLDLYSDAAGRAWWKENGYEIALEFDLAPGSRSRKVLDAYAKTKGRA